MMRRALTASLVTQPGSNPAHLCAAAPTISRHYFMTILMCFPCPRPRHPSLISPTEPVKPTGIRLRIPSEPGETQEEKQQEQHLPTASATVSKLHQMMMREYEYEMQKNLRCIALIAVRVLIHNEKEAARAACVQHVESGVQHCSRRRSRSGA